MIFSSLRALVSSLLALEINYVGQHQFPINLVAFFKSPLPLCLALALLGIDQLAGLVFKQGSLVKQKSNVLLESCDSDDIFAIERINRNPPLDSFFEPGRLEDIPKSD